MKLLGIGVVALLIGTFIGWGFAKADKTDSKIGDQASLQTGIGGGPDDTTAMRTTLHTLLKEHGVIASTHLKNLYDGKDPNPTEKLLSENSEKVVSLFDDYGDAATRDSLRRGWQEHIAGYENYTRAKKGNNDDRADEVRQEFQDHAREMGIVINRLLPTITANQATDLMKEHVELTLAVVDAHASGNVAAETASMKQGYDQAGEMADSLYNAILERNQNSE